MFPTPPTRNATPSAAAARPLAPLVVDDSCAVTDATPANTMPTRPIDAPATNEADTLRPLTISTPARAMTSAMLAPTATISAAARPA